MTEKKQPRDKVIIEYIRAHSPIRGRKVVEDLEQAPHNIPRTTTFAYLTQLVKQHVLSREGTRRSYEYSVAKSDT